MNEIVTPRSLGLSREDLPNSYIGRSVPRPNARKLVEGRATYTDDVTPPRLVHAAFLRSPYPHARIVSIGVDAALKVPGVLRVFTGADLAEVCDPWVAVLAHLKGMKSAPQYPLPLTRATWQGEAIVAVVADSRAAAEDGVAAIEVEFEPLPTQVDMETALEPGAVLVQPELGDNL
ncbi:MAG: xanthine dehydrogenase family protein molybdopterin-binding subunit, partial [Alphaproteobacteria bacterium]